MVSWTIGLSRSSARRSSATPTRSPAHTGGRSSVQPTPDRPNPGDELGAIRHDDLRRRRWRWSPDVGREVAQGHVGLVANATDHRQRVPDDGTDDRLVVECPEVLERAPTTGQDRHGRRLLRLTGGNPGSRVALDAPEGAHQAGRRAFPLDPRGNQHDPRQRPAPRQDVADVLPDGAGRARDHGDRRGSGRQGAFAGGVEQPFSRQSRLQRLEPEHQIPETGWLDRLHVKLERTLRLEQVDPTVGHDPQPRLGLECRALAVVAKPDALELAALVLQREIRVSRGRYRDPSDLPLDPQVGQQVGSGAHRRPGSPG